MNKKHDSVAKGGSAVALARLVGMVFSFLLFILLARQSAEAAGVFKTVMTYIIIAESMSMLGLQRWLATEIATLDRDRWALFWTTTVFTLFISLVLCLIYFGVTRSGIYDSQVNDGILLGVLAVIPSGLYASVQSALLGNGQSHYLGKLNMYENLGRCAIGILLIAQGQSVYWLISVFVAARWIAALQGFYYLRSQLTHQAYSISKAFLAKLKHAAPKFAIIIAASLMLRNAGLLVIPALSTLTEAGRFAVSYQLYDLMLILPSVLAMTSIHVFSNKAQASRTGLKQAAMHLATTTGVAIFPIAAITGAFSKQVITLFYGDKYLHGEQTLMILMLAAVLTILDIVLSQVMQAKKDYHNDMVSIVAAAIVAAISTYFFTQRLGANGAAFALTLALLVNIIVRCALLKSTFSWKLLTLSTWRPAVASAMLFVCFRYGLKLEFLPWHDPNGFLWLSWLPAAALFYLFVLWFLGGLKRSHLMRLQRFLFKH